DTPSTTSTTSLPTTTITPCGKCKAPVVGKCKPYKDDCPSTARERTDVGCDLYDPKCKCCEECEQYYKCKDQGGKCQPERNYCDGIKTKDCKDPWCLCCIPNASSTTSTMSLPTTTIKPCGKCKAPVVGKCKPYKDDCPSTARERTDVGCDLYDPECKCCEECEQYYKCTDQGGECQPDRNYCNGTKTTDCKDPWCCCCIPNTPSSTSTMSLPTTTKTR
ncbi:unnamed protein product, partial [Meganyctiphanes norvegica]